MKNIQQQSIVQQYEEVYTYYQNQKNKIDKYLVIKEAITAYMSNVHEMVASLQHTVPVKTVQDISQLYDQKVLEYLRGVVTLLVNDINTYSTMSHQGVGHEHREIIEVVFPKIIEKIKKDIQTKELTKEHYGEMLVVTDKHLAKKVAVLCVSHREQSVLYDEIMLVLVHHIPFMVSSTSIRCIQEISEQLKKCNIKGVTHGEAHNKALKSMIEIQHIVDELVIGIHVKKKWFSLRNKKDAGKCVIKKGIYHHLLIDIHEYLTHIFSLGKAYIHFVEYVLHDIEEYVEDLEFGGFESMLSEAEQQVKMNRQQQYWQLLEKKMKLVGAYTKTLTQTKIMFVKAEDTIVRTMAEIKAIMKHKQTIDKKKIAA